MPPVLDLRQDQSSSSDSLFSFLETVVPLMIQKNEQIKKERKTKQSIQDLLSQANQPGKESNVQLSINPQTGNIEPRVTISNVDQYRDILVKRIQEEMKNIERENKRIEELERERAKFIFPEGEPETQLLPAGDEKQVLKVKENVEKFGQRVPPVRQPNLFVELLKNMFSGQSGNFHSPNLTPFFEKISSPTGFINPNL